VDEAAAAMLPNEDTFAMPAAWRRDLHPRRGGVPGPKLSTPRDPTATVRSLLDTKGLYGQPVGRHVERRLAHSQSKPELVAAARDYLAGGGTGAGESTPLGAAVFAGAAAEGFGPSRSDRVAPLADAWVATRGVVFAAQCVAELAGLYAVDHVRRASGGELDAWQALGYLPAAQRVRARLAVASDDEYAAAGEALAGYRAGSARRQIVTSYLMPTWQDWVEADCALAGRVNRLAHRSLFCALGTMAQLDRVAGELGEWYLFGSGYFQLPLATMVDAIGPAIALTIGQWLDSWHTDTAARKRLAGVLAALPTDEAFGMLAARHDRPEVRPALLEAMGRYPVRALRVLSVLAGGASTATGGASTAAGSASTVAGSASTAPGGAAELLRAHVASRAAVLAAAMPGLPAHVQERVRAVAADTGAVAAAPASALPRVLVEPPWLATRPRTAPEVVDGLSPAVEATVVWLPGEREEWAATRGESSLDSPRGRVDWAGYAEQFLAGKGYNAGSLFAEGPEELVRPLLAGWRPEGWEEDGWGRCIAARFELDALPALLRFARSQPSTSGDCLLPFVTAEVAALMADWLVRLKTVRQLAQSWLARHPAAAAGALVPAAVGRPGKRRQAAEAALRAVAAAGHGDLVLAAAGEYGEAPAAAVQALLAVDRLEALPAEIPVPPAWGDPGVLPQVLLAGRGHTLPAEAVRHLCTMLAMSKPGGVYAGVEVVKHACDAASLAEFGWALFERWRENGMPAEAGWVLDALGWIGDDETVRRLAPVVRAWPGEGYYARAVQGLDVLATVGSDVALLHLHGIAQRVKSKALQDLAGEKLAEVAAGLELTTDELADRLVPDLGLDSDGTLRLDYGPRQFVVGFDERLKPYVSDVDGARLKALPKPGARDDQDEASAAYQRFAALKKDARTIAADQVLRLERAMVVQRRWPATAFRDLLLAHPLLWHIVRRLVWATFTGDRAGTGDRLQTAFRVAEDRTFADVEDKPVTVDDDRLVGVAHPVHLGASALSRWSDVFADYEIGQPFPQLGREVYELTDEERAASRLGRVEGATVATASVLGLAKSGWRRGETWDGGVQSCVYRPLPAGGSVVVSLDPGIIVGDPTEWHEQQLRQVWLSNQADGEERPPADAPPFGRLDPVIASEILGDLVGLTTSDRPDE
jgi:uncharacterized protein DUF4132